MYQDGSAGSNYSAHFDVFKMPDDTYLVHTLFATGPKWEQECCSSLSTVFDLILDSEENSCWDFIGNTFHLKTIHGVRMSCGKIKTDANLLKLFMETPFLWAVPKIKTDDQTLYWELNLLTLPYIRHTPQVYQIPTW